VTWVKAGELFELLARVPPEFTFVDIANFEFV